MALRLDRGKSAEIPVTLYTDDGMAHEARVEFAIARATATRPSHSLTEPTAAQGAVAPATGLSW